jgi:hypothetical protein
MPMHARDVALVVINVELLFIYLFFTVMAVYAIALISLLYDAANL